MTNIPAPAKYSVRTELRPQDPARAAEMLDIIHQGRITADDFTGLFPGASLQDAICHHGTNADGRSHYYFADDVMECELEDAPGTDSEPSHQSLFIEALLSLEKKPQMPMPVIRDRARRVKLNKISPLAIEYLLLTADGGWDPDRMICRDIANAAHGAGIRAEDLMAPEQSAQPQPEPDPQ